MLEKCCNCGEEYESETMISYFTGRSTKYLCWGCYKIGQSEAKKVEVKTADKKKRELNKR